MGKTKDIVTRGPDGLMPAQREYLQKYAETGTEANARKALGLSNRRVARWLREDEAYQKVYAEAVGGIHTAVQLRLKSIEEELPDAIKRLMSAAKDITVQCPFDREHKFTITVDHPVVQARMVEMLMKAQGHLKDVRRIEGEVDVTHLTVGQRMALALWNTGKKISEQSRRELIQMGLIENEPREPPIEGEAREIPQE